MLAQLYLAGSVQINGCFGFFARYLHSTPTDKALIITAGHCAKLPRRLNVKEYAYDMNSEIPVTFLANDGSPIGTLSTSKLLYATVTGTDVALYQLPQSFEEIMKRTDIRPLPIALKGTAPGSKIRIPTGMLAKVYECKIEAYVHQLINQDYVWSSSIRYSPEGCKMTVGTSGSPVIDLSSFEVIGLTNAGNNETDDSCMRSNVCEVSPAGTVSYRRGTSYGQQTHQIYSCLTNERKLDLNIDGCQLFH